MRPAAGTALSLRIAEPLASQSTFRRDCALARR